jgi:hypothetical protein
MADVIVTIPGATNVTVDDAPATSVVVIFPASNYVVTTVIDRGILFGIEGPSGPAGGVDTVNGQSGNVTLDTSEIPENPTALYFTNTRVYTKVKAALVAGSNVSFTYNDALQTITIAASGNVLSVNGQTGAVVLDTDDITEGTTNKYYDDALFDASLAAKTTDDLTEGTTNLYYAEGLFDASLATKTTDDLPEGTNLYFSTTRVEDVLTAEDVTKMGNTFNGANELVQLDATGKLPAVDGSNLTNLNIPPSTGGDLYLFYNY